jgi:hypothetical protein
MLQGGSQIEALVTSALLLSIATVPEFDCMGLWSLEVLVQYNAAPYGICGGGRRERKTGKGK